MVTSGWTLIVDVPKEAVDIFDRAMTPISLATSSFKIDGSELWRVECFTISRPNENAIVGAIALASKIAGIAEPAVHIASLPTIDWVAENQKSFKPISAGRFFIHPTGFNGEFPAGAITLAIDAGPAFGTGSHGSTNGCLLALEWLSRNPPFGRILDLGCGTGILALALARRWKRKVIAADVDPYAVATTQINARLNKVSHLVRPVLTNGPKAGTVRHQGPYGLIVANILAKPLIEMTRDMERILRPGSILILSGFTKHQRNSVRNAYQSRKYCLAHMKVIDGWTTLVLKYFGTRR